MSHALKLTSLVLLFLFEDFSRNLSVQTSPSSASLPHWLCILNGIGNWGTAQAGWFWTMAYAYVRRRRPRNRAARPPAHAARPSTRAQAVRSCIAETTLWPSQSPS